MAGYHAKRNAGAASRSVEELEDKLLWEREAADAEAARQADAETQPIERVVE